MSTRIRAVCLATLFAVASVNTGCGTILGYSGTQKINVTINPDRSDATVFVNGRKAGQGSGEYEIEAGLESNTIRVETADKFQGSGAITREPRTGVIVADALMLIFPIYIDYATGGMYRMKKDISINLGKYEAPAPEPVRTTDDPKPGPARTGKTKTCAYCGESRPADDNNCPHCGQK